MARRANSYRAHNVGQRRARQVRVIVTAIVERQGQLLMTQLAQGQFAGFWLLPSGTVEEGTVERAVAVMLRERTGYPALEQKLLGVVEETKLDVLSLRFVFAMQVGEREYENANPEILQARWFSREAVGEVLDERDVVPNFGVMSLLRAWVDARPLKALESLDDQALCPCGSGFAFTGCCGWDVR